MKVISNENAESVFEPFLITLKIETLGEAKLLHHIFNHPELKKALFERANIISETHEINKNVPDNFNYQDRDEIVRYLNKFI